MDRPRALLGGLSPARFLADYWQQRPLLIRQALPGYRAPLSPDELAGLACEPEVESRLVLERDGAQPWQVEHGPFPERRFASLPATHWTLLVQEVDRHWPALAGLLDQFDFIPHWRIDDVMVSYAPAQGSVGPHCDEYDVFLLQGQGRRHWHIDGRPGACAEAAVDGALLPDTELRILAQFEADQDWVLEPGDMLYLPPGVAHHGVALDDCLTLSVGFRAPSADEMLAHFCDTLLDANTALPRYTDPGLQATAHPGAISPSALAQVRALLRGLLDDDDALDRWFGRFITEPAPAAHAAADAVTECPAPSGDGLRRYLEAGGVLYRHPDSRFSYIDHATPPCVRLYVDGTEYTLAATARALVQALCDRRELVLAETLPHLPDATGLDLIARLLSTGKLETDGALDGA